MDPAQHPRVIVVADGNLWYGGTIPTPLSDDISWDRMTTGIDIASAPDCTVTTGDEVHLVVRTSDGEVMLIQGKSDDFNMTNLGRYY